MVLRPTDEIATFQFRVTHEVTTFPVHLIINAY